MHTYTEYIICVRELKSTFLYFYFMCIGVLPAFTSQAYNAHGVHKKVLKPLELEGQTVVSFHVGAKSQTLLPLNNS